MTHYFPPPRLSLDAYPSDAGDLSGVPYQGAGVYVSTGSDVALRAAPVISNPEYGPGSNVAEMVQTGDLLDAASTVAEATQNVGFVAVKHRITGTEGWMSVLYLKPAPEYQDPGALAVPQGQPLPSHPLDPVPGPGPGPAPKPSSGGGAAVVVGLLLIVAVGYGLAK